MTDSQILRQASNILLAREMREADVRPGSDRIGRRLYELVETTLLQAARELENA